MSAGLCLGPPYSTASNPIASNRFPSVSLRICLHRTVLLWPCSVALLLRARRCLVPFSACDLSHTLGDRPSPSPEPRELTGAGGTRDRLRDRPVCATAGDKGNPKRERGPQGPDKGQASPGKGPEGSVQGTVPCSSPENRFLGPRLAQSGWYVRTAAQRIGEA